MKLKKLGGRLLQMREGFKFSCFLFQSPNFYLSRVLFVNLFPVTKGSLRLEGSLRLVGLKNSHIERGFSGRIYEIYCLFAKLRGVNLRRCEKVLWRSSFSPSELFRPRYKHRLDRNHYRSYKFSNERIHLVEHSQFVQATQNYQTDVFFSLSGLK